MREIFRKSAFTSFIYFSVLFAVLAQESRTSILIRNVNVITMAENGHVLKKQDVYLEDGIIQKITPASRKTDSNGYRVIEGKGKYLMPGMADMHAHLPSEGGFDLEEYLFLNLANGVTSLRSMRGKGEHLELKEKIDRKELTGPSLYLTAPPLVERGFRPYVANILFSAYKKDGFDQVKHLWTAKEEDFKVISEVAQKHGLKVIGHAPQNSLETAVKYNMHSVEHIDAFTALYERDSLAYEKTIEKMLEQQMFHCPDMLFYFNVWNQLPLQKMQQYEGIEYVAPAIVAEWTKAMEERIKKANEKDPEAFEASKKKYAATLRLYAQLLNEMNQKGANLLISGSDGYFVVPGFSMLEEMRLFKAAGLSNYAILKAATVNAGLALDGKWGTVEVGKRADLILLKENPLRDIETMRKIEGVCIAGEWWTKEAISQRLNEIKSKHTASAK